MLEPRPDYEEGIVDFTEFDVDEIIPPMTIPLSGDDHLNFDFGAAYQKTFEDALYGYKMDYSQLPLNFERYSEADRAHIANRMLAVLKAAQAGVDLDASAPLPVDELPLERALEQLAAFAS